MSADSVAVALENIINQLKKDELTDLEWGTVSDLVHTLHGTGQLFSGIVPNEPLASMQTQSKWRMDFSHARKDLSEEVHRRDKQAALKHAELALAIWQARVAR